MKLLSGTLLAISLMGCSSQVILQDHLGAELSARIQPDTSTAAKIIFTSRLPELFEYDNSGGHTFKFPLNSALQNKLNDYAREKFTGHDTKKQTELNIEVVSAAVEYDFKQSTGETLASLFAGVNSGQALAKATVTLTVSASGAINVNPVSIVGSGESQGGLHSSQYSRSGSVLSVYAEAMDRAIDRALVSIDKHVSSKQPLRVAD